MKDPERLRESASLIRRAADSLDDAARAESRTEAEGHALMAWLLLKEGKRFSEGRYPEPTTFRSDPPYPARREP